jgi:transglutaminase-like putative cysteine protease
MRVRDPRPIVLAAAVLAAVLVGAAFAAETPPSWDLPAAEVQKALAKTGGADAFPGAAAVTVFDRREVFVEETGMARTVQHTLAKALTAAGARELSVAELSYDPLSAAVEVLRCRVLAAGGAVRDVDVASVQDHPDTQGTILWNARHRLVPVGRLEAGDAVELVTRRVGFTYALLDGEQAAGEARFVPPMRGHFYDIVPFFADRPVVEQRYRVTIPAAKNLQYQLFNGAAEVEDRTADGMRTVTLTMRGFRPAEREPNMVAWSDVAPKLLLTTAHDWRAKAVWFHGVQEDAQAFAVTPEVKRVADEVTAGLERADDKVAALTHWVAENIRYIGLHMGEGEGYTLHPAAMTLRDRGGVCKDKAGILTALLRAAGLEAYAGMTMAGEKIEKIAADQFNHCITVWRRPDGATQLLDPTWVPGARELWSSREQQQEVLMGLPEGADIITTPISPPSDHPLSLTVRSTLVADGTLRGTLKVTGDGQSDAGLRRPYRGRPRSQWPAIDEGLLAAVDPRAVVRVTSRTDPDDLRVPFAIEAEFTIPGYARVLDDGSLLLTPLAARHPIGAASRAEELTLPLKPKERRYPVRIGCSKVVTLEERIALPPGAKVEGLPDDAKLEGPGALASTWKVTGGELAVSETLTLDRRIFEPEQWPAVRAALEAFRKLGETAVVVGPAGEKAGSGLRAQGSEKLGSGKQGSEKRAAEAGKEKA